MRQLPPAAWVTVEQIFVQLSSLIVFAILAPILGPHAFGLMAIVMVFVGFWDAVPSLAATDALISIRAIDHIHYSSITIVGGLLGLLVGAVLWTLASPLAAALGDPDFSPIMRAMAPLALIQALAIAPTAAAQHEMHFEALTLRTIASMLAGGAVGLILAFSGAGVWALVWQALVQRTIALVVLWSRSPTGFTFVISGSHMRELATFALPTMFARFMSWASGQLPRLFIGLFLGPTGLGLFTVATRLNEVVSQVAIIPKAIVARVNLRQLASEPEMLAAAIRRNLMQTSFVAFPICLGGAAIVKPLINAWLDARWQGAILPAQLMLLLGIPFTTIYISASILLAMNRQKSEALIAVIHCSAIIIAVACVARYGVAAAVAAMLACAVAIVPFITIVMRRQIGIAIRDIIVPQLPSLASAIVMGIAVWTLDGVLQQSLGGRCVLVLLILAGVAIYALIVSIMMPRETRAAAVELIRRLRVRTSHRPGGA